MNDNLFDPNLNQEGAYGRLNSSKSTWGIEARRVLSKIYSLYPDLTQDLQRRFTSKDDLQYRGAYFELIIYGLIVSNLSEELIEIEPDNWQRRPDFLIKSNSEIVIEAKVLRTENLPDFTFTPSEIDFCDKLKSLKSDKFLYDVFFTEKLERYVSKNEIRKFLGEIERSLKSLEFENWPYDQFSALDTITPLIYLRSKNEDINPYEIKNNVLIIDGKIYIGLLPRRNSKHSYLAWILEPRRHGHFCSNFEDYESRRDKEFRKKLTDWDKEYSEIDKPKVLAVWAKQETVFDPEQKWIKKIINNWFAKERGFDAVWIFAGLNPPKMYNTRHEIFFNSNLDIGVQSVLRQTLLPYTSSSLKSDTYPPEISEALGWDFDIGYDTEKDKRGVIQRQINELQQSLTDPIQLLFRKP